MEELRDTSDKIMYSRRTMIDLSADYNIQLVTFPSSVVANVLALNPKKDWKFQLPKLKLPKCRYDQRLRSG